MSLADFYALAGAVAIESECAGDDVILSASDPDEYKRLARAAQAVLLKDFKDALVLIQHVREWADGGWTAQGHQFMERIYAQSRAATSSETAEGDEG